ncbi:hypothetical protein [Gemmatimonas sp.]|uniref:hypothetical protein n=1 Tax=Gemmatimonas sp. TaxID=1962908 RepID=UPI0037BE4EFC
MYLTNNESGQYPLNFPMRWNDQLDGLMGFVTSGERRLAKSSSDVWAMLTPKTDGELARSKRAITTPLPRVNVVLKAAGQHRGR